jgi:hypothetical protein
MDPASPGNISAATAPSAPKEPSLSTPIETARSTPMTPMISRGAGGFDFANSADSSTADRVPWTAQALPTVTALTDLPQSLATPDAQLPPDALQSIRGAEHSVECDGAILRVQLTSTGTGQLAVLLPLDQLFDIRAASALRLWRGLTGRRPGPPPGALTTQMAERLALGVRALDAHQSGAHHQEIAAVLFDAAEISRRDWIDHDIRDRTGRLVRMALALMNGGYRRLLLYPYRRRTQSPPEE